MLSIVQLKNFGPFIEPCGIPDLISNNPEYILFQQTEPDSFENQKSKIFERCGRPCANSKPIWLT